MATTKTKPDTTVEKPRPRPKVPKPAPTVAVPSPGALPIRAERLARNGKRRRTPSHHDVNPLREGLRLERVPDPHVMVLFGATGDLSHRKVFPALAQLWRTNLLPADWALLAVGRRPFDDESFREDVAGSLHVHCRIQLDPEIERDFLSRISYIKGDFSDNALFDSMTERLESIHDEMGTGHNVMFYLATQPSAFPQIVQQLGRCGLDHEKHDGGWRRIIVEKPFGRDFDSARRLNREMLRVFRETQVYRIDHYLGKETVRNLLVFRFGNGIFEPLWNRRYVDHVQITVAESIGIEGRGSFYEETGAVRDVLQNHLLQLVSLVAMEPPATFEADALRDEKVKVLRAIGTHRADPFDDVVRGQYASGWVGAESVPAYRDEQDVDPKSETETFVAARLMIDDWRWSGVPFYVRTGKRLPKRATEIAIQFREVPHHLFRDTTTEPDPNLLAIRIQPDEGIMLRFGAKVPGLGLDVRSVTMDFTYGSAFSVDSPDAYETLILDGLQGDASLFTRADEVEEAWSLVDPFIDAWANGPAPDFPNYEAGTWGPPEADELIAREGRRWRRI